MWNMMPLNCSLAMVFTCPLLSLCKIPSTFRENVMWYYCRFLAHHHAVGELAVHPPSRIVFHPKDKKLPCTLPALRRTLALGRGRILIPGFIRSLPTSAACDVSHCLLLGDVDMNFPFTEDEIRRHFSFYLTHYYLYVLKLLFVQ